MLRNLDDLLAVVRRIYGDVEPPKEIRLLAALPRLRDGDAADVARSLGTTAKRIRDLAAAPDPVAHVLGRSFSDITDKDLANARKMLGQLLIGQIAEHAFERLYRDTMGTHEIRLEDERSGRNETDYRVINGQDRPVFRINIKSFAAQFRNALTLVKLQPDDCFALATYKIHQALEKQKKEVLNYIFVIVGVPELTGEHVGAVIDDDLVRFVSLMKKGRRTIEEQIVSYLLGTESDPDVRTSIADFIRQVDRAQWRVISAVKAHRLVHALLFERVYAVRVRSFARSYGNAEVDMHFSLRNDLTPLQDFLRLLKDRGLHGISTFLASGEI